MHNRNIQCLLESMAQLIDLLNNAHRAVTTTEFLCPAKKP